MNSVYSERAALVAFLAKIYPSAIAYNDPNEPDWPVVYLDTPEGQLSWHVAADDLHMFEDVPRDEAVTWDGHSTAEKYARLVRLNPDRDQAVTA